MLLYFFAISCITLASGYRVIDSTFLLQDDAEELYWPDTYSVKATKLSLTSNLIQDFEAWKTNQSSRVNYNDGSVIAIKVFSDPSKGTKGAQYEIHPETIDGEEPKLVCYMMYQKYDFGEFDLDSILPSLSEDEEYEAVGNETVAEKETVKFEYIEKSRDKEVHKTIWAEYALYEGASIWIPVKYEIKKYNHILGSLIRHEIWDFYEFTIEFNEDVFDADDYNCEETKAVEHSADSDKVIKELMFIDPDNKRHVDHVFDKYLINFARKYAHEREHAMRKDIFNENMRLVATVNKQKLGYKLTINQFSDRTPEELKRSKGLTRRAPGKTGNIAFPYDEAKIKEAVNELPKDFDLRLLDLVTPVMNQEDCGSCWTFGTTSAVEGALARVNGGRLLSLSNQALLDCVWPFGAGGCKGGSDNGAYKWMMEYGLPTVEEYGPYKNKEDFCHIANMTKIYPIRGYTDVTPFSNGATKVALVNHGPLSVSVHVTKQFEQYSSGVFYDKNCDPLDLDHEVTLVGYGERDDDMYWIIKNSWGPNWGIDGYMLISARENMCGITTEPTYVVF